MREGGEEKERAREGRGRRMDGRWRQEVGWKVEDGRWRKEVEWKVEGGGRMEGGGRR